VPIDFAAGTLFGNQYVEDALGRIAGVETLGHAPTPPERRER
jgi:hypothetical protein